MTPVIDLQGSMVLLGRFPALTDITMTASEGEIIIVKGPNGAGKSTLLRLCAGLLPMKQGKGSVLGFDIATERMSIRPHVGMLGHKTGLYPDLTVKENMQFWAQVANAEIRAKRASIVGVITAINIPIINRSVEWWENNTLHQKSSLTDGKLENLTLFTLFLGLMLTGVCYLWLMTHRFRVGWLQTEIENEGALGVLQERIAESTASSAETITKEDGEEEVI